MKEIELTQGKVALVDDEDYEWLNQWKWYALYFTSIKGYYAVKRKKNNKQYMHRLIMGLGFGDRRQVDHRNHNGLDNRKENLRICTYQQNHMNQISHFNTSSKHKGVFWHKRDKRWMAQIRINQKNIYLGYFDNEIDAAKAYDKKAKKLFGEFANLNFPERGI